jgi:hypothetical protein
MFGRTSKRPEGAIRNYADDLTFNQSAADAVGSVAGERRSSNGF